MPVRRINAATLKAKGLQSEGTGIQPLPFLGSGRGVLFRGLAHLVAAYPKVGKTELMTRLITEWSASGIKTSYFTEESEIVWMERLRRTDGDLTGIELIFALGCGQQELLREVDACSADVVLIDTIRLLQIRDENDNSAINRVLAPLIAMSRNKEVTLVLLHHTRKGGGSFGEAAAGGHALVGAVDVSIDILRDGSDNRRQLRGLARLVDIPTLIYELTPYGTMRVIGEPTEVALQTIENRLLAAGDHEWRNTKEWRDQLTDPQPSEDQVLKAMTRLASRGDFERDPPVAEGPQPGKTYRWRLSQNLTSDDPSH